MRVFWTEERRSFLNALNRIPRHRARRKAEMLILYDTGCRVSELVALDITDFDRQRKSLQLINCKAEGHPKREVPIHSQTQRAILHWLRERPEGGTALFVSQQRKRLSVRQVQDDYALVCRLAGLDSTGVHTLRHTAATRLLDDRVLDVHQVSRRLGHRATTTTFRYYVHASVEAEAQAIRNARL